MEFKLFNLWDTSGIKIEDPGLKDYIALTPQIVPRTGGRYAKQKFYKNKYTVIERLINHMMVPGHRGKKHHITSGQCGGKSHTAFNIVEATLKLIEARTKQNPVGVFVKAIENAAQIRFRPILMTTAAMVFGVIPLITATGAGALSRYNIGLVIATDDNSITLIDKTNSEVCIKESSIDFIKEVSR